MDKKQLKKDYKKLKVEYRMAKRKALATVKNIEELLSTGPDRVVFDGTKSRMKKFKSVVEKCNRKNYENTPADQPPEFNIDTIRNHMQDVAGIRVITLYRSDIYRVFDAIKNTDLVITHIDDYIKNPKDSGYRSLHIVVMVSIPTNDGTKLVPVEIQIRNKFMDVWATLDHELRYKIDPDLVPNPEDVVKLQNMAITMDGLDDESEHIRFKKPAN